MKPQSKDADWSQLIKMNAGYVCQRSGVMDQELLDSHHKRPKSEFPELRYQEDNGECISLLWHAFEHRKKVHWCNLILWRTVLILWRRYVGGIPPEIQDYVTNSQTSLRALSR